MGLDAARRAAVVSYITLKLMNACVFGSVAKWLVLSISPGSAAAFRTLAATMALTKLLHPALSSAAVRWLLAPPLLAIVTLLNGIAFVALIAAGAVFAHGVGSAVLVVVLAATHALLSQLTDATLDALFREEKSSLQTSRKAASVAAALCGILQLVLPWPWSLAPAVCLAAVSCVLCAWTAAMWVGVPQAESRSLSASATSACSLHVPTSQVFFFASSVVVGGNGEQLLDSFVNLEIDAGVAGGKVAAAVIKEVVALCSNAVSFVTFFWRSYRARYVSPVVDAASAMQRELRVAWWTLLAWALVQVPRLASLVADADALPLSLVGCLIVLDKVRGCLCDCIVCDRCPTNTVFSHAANRQHGRRRVVCHSDTLAHSRVGARGIDTEVTTTLAMAVSVRGDGDADHVRQRR
jgi:hypothetical protein